MIFIEYSGVPFVGGSYTANFATFYSLSTSDIVYDSGILIVISSIMFRLWVSSKWDCFSFVWIIVFLSEVVVCL